MRRRSLLGAVATGVTAGIGGCLGGHVIVEKQESVRIEAHRSWAEEIEEADGSGSISYTVRSEDKRFQVFYFTQEENYRQYREITLGSGNPQEPGRSDVPTGHEELSRIAVRNDERDVFEVEMPRDDGRYEMEFDQTHYFVVDYSNYGMGIQVPETAHPLQVSVGLEVVEDRF